VNDIQEPYGVNVWVIHNDSWCITASASGHCADVVALDRVNEGFGHSIALWTYDRVVLVSRPIASEVTSIGGDVTAARLLSHGIIQLS
jgi:hypothetical protein